MSDAIPQYHQAEGHSPTTVEWHQERRDRFYAFLIQRGYPTALDAIRAQHLREFIGWGTRLASPAGCISSGTAWPLNTCALAADWKR